MRGVEQDEAGHVLRIQPGIHILVQPAQAMADEHIRRLQARLRQQGPLLGGDGAGVARRGGFLAVAVAGAVVHEHAVLPGHFGHDLGPHILAVAHGRLENHGQAALAAQGIGDAGVGQGRSGGNAWRDWRGWQQGAAGKTACQQQAGAGEEHGARGAADE
ncbi:hypothetical protein D3C72_1515220 [compost metagenome]